MTPIATLKAAAKRAKSMGVASAYDSAYSKHPLTACVSNYLGYIDEERKADEPDYLSILIWLYQISEVINAYCDNTRIQGDPAAQYWLERFARRCDGVCLLNKLPNTLQV